MPVIETFHKPELDCLSSVEAGIGREFESDYVWEGLDLVIYSAVHVRH